MHDKAALIHNANTKSDDPLYNNCASVCILKTLVLLYVLANTTSFNFCVSIMP